jgi:hypothetical protein
MKKTTKNTIFWKSTVSAARILGLFLLMVGLVFSIAAQDKRQVTPDDLVSLKQAYNLNVSPDGKWVVFVVGEPADPKKPEKSGDTNIWIVPSDGSTQPRLFASSPKDESQPRWSPDGRYLAFLSTRGEPVGEEKEPSSQIYLLRIDGGEAEQLTKVEGSVGTFRWSPDGRQIAFLVRDPLSAGGSLTWPQKNPSGLPGRTSMSMILPGLRTGVSSPSLSPRLLEKMTSGCRSSSLLIGRRGISRGP